MCQPVDPLLPFFQPLDQLRGVSAATAERIAKVAGGRLVRDLLFHMPETYVDRRARPTIADAQPGTVATLAVEVVSVQAPEAGSKQPWRVTVSDVTGFAEVAMWNKDLLGKLRPKQAVMLSGKVEMFGDRKQIRSPRVVDADRAEGLPPLEPVWPLTAKLVQQQVERAMRAALGTVPELPEWHDGPLLKREGWPRFHEALRAVQAPDAPPGDAPRFRLAYDELLAHQVAMTWARNRARTRPGRAILGDGHLGAEALRRFGFPPTESQRRAMAEVEVDLAAPRRMLRLLQGDVGSGKTLVALHAMLRAAEAGHQAALMAPTEVLAKQHYRTISRISPVPIELLTGSVKGAERRRILAGLARGSVPLIVGTHALFQDAVEYKDLALAVIDEQHRFGVEQRMTLGKKGQRTDVLVMTATPIPRSLLLTQYGEMDVSRLTEKPGGRQPIRTTIHSLATLPDMIEAIARALARNERIYWVCPMVSESELIDLAAAQARFADLHALFGDTVGLAHGQQDPAIRDRALADFAAGRVRLLVATTVIEVGVDVPEATVMVIEHAERFGLAQLHQLRGRVGRGTAQSYCLLLHEDGLTQSMQRRLTLLRETEDGFVIADEDFRIRGGGDVLGKRQSGLPGYRLADVPDQERLLEIARKDAELLLHQEPGLDGKRGPAVRTLLRLFSRGAAVRTLDAG